MADASNYFKNTSSIKFWVQHVLPLVYDDSLSYYELLCKVVDKINVLIENNENLPTYIVELIKEQLEEIGNLEEIIQEVVAAYLVDVTYTKEEIDNLLSELQNTIENETAEYYYNKTEIDDMIANITPEKTETNLAYILTTKSQWYGSYNSYAPTEPQGLAFIGTENVSVNVNGSSVVLPCDRIVTFKSCSISIGDGWGQYSDPVLIEEFYISPDRVNTFRTRAIQRTGLMHCNGAAYDPKTNRIYTCLRGYRNEGESATTTMPLIAAISLSDLSVIGYYLCDVTPSIIGNDRKHIDDVDYLTYYTRYGEDVYSFTFENATIYNTINEALNGEAIHLTKMFTIPQRYQSPSSNGFGPDNQGICACDGVIYVGGNTPDSVIAYNTSGEVQSIINFPEYDSYGHPIVYPEDMDIDPDTYNVYVNDWVYINKTNYSGTNNDRMCYVHMFNPITNTTVEKVSSTEKQNSFFKIDTVYVNNEFTGFYQCGSISNPFTTLSEAVYACETVPDLHRINNQSSTAYDEHLYVFGCNLMFDNAITVNSAELIASYLRFNSPLTVSGAKDGVYGLRLNQSTVIVAGLSVSNNDIGIYTTGSTLVSQATVSGSGNTTVISALDSDISAFFGNTQGNYIFNRSKLRRSYLYSIGNTSPISITTYGNAYQRIRGYSDNLTATSFTGFVRYGVLVYHPTETNGRYTIFITPPLYLSSSAGLRATQIFTKYGTIFLTFNDDTTVNTCTIDVNTDYANSGVTVEVYDKIISCES